jgi:hypothetical protein
LSAYAQKNKDTKPVLLIVGGIHGGELEGIVAVLNLIHVLETGADYRGVRHDYITAVKDQFRWLLIPCMNPDGRARISIDTFVGLSTEDFRYYMQGTWKDGTLCDWPACKEIHPILEASSFLGAYFNDNGINMMHDNFFSPMANETQLLLELAEREAVDATVLLHGGANTVNHILPLHYATGRILDLQNQFIEQLTNAKTAQNLKFWPMYNNLTLSPVDAPPSFNFTSALHHVSGGMSMTYECNMGLEAPGEKFTYEEMINSHFVLFEQLTKFIADNYPLFK